MNGAVSKRDQALLQGFQWTFFLFAKTSLHRMLPPAAFPKPHTGPLASPSEGDASSSS